MAEHGKTITLSQNASEVIRNMQGQVAQIGQLYGEHSPEHAAAAVSLSNALTNLMLSGFGDAEVSRDGEISLFVNEAGFGYALVFHRDRGAAERKLKAHELDPAEHPELLERYGVAGTWSTHS